jgi:hypothetical protein
MLLKFRKLPTERGTFKRNQLIQPPFKMKTFITILILLVAVGCGEAAYQISSIGSEIEKLEEKIVGSYEDIHEGHFIHKLIFLENGKTESYMNAQGNEHPCKFGTWKIKGHRPYELNRVHWIQEKETVVLQIYSNGDLTEIAIIKTINERGERIEKRKSVPKEDQRTYKKVE